MNHPVRICEEMQMILRSCGWYFLKERINSSVNLKGIVHLKISFVMIYPHVVLNICDTCWQNESQLVIQIVKKDCHFLLRNLQNDV